MKILIVGGNFEAKPNNDGTYGRPSSLITKISEHIQNRTTKHDETALIKTYNGGRYDELAGILDKTPKFDIVFWFANVPDNSLPKVRDVKAVAPKVMLVTSKRNDNNKYSFQELVQRALASKSNLMFEFSKDESSSKSDKPVYNTRVFDPLGCEWYDGTDIQAAINAAFDRLIYLKSITRQSTTQSDTSNGLILSWYFDAFKEDMHQSENKEYACIPDETKFIELVHRYAERFHEIMKPAKNVKRFLGNCSMKPMPPQVGRCSKGMPSFKSGEYVFVSQRNVDKEYLDIRHFVPVYEKDGKIYYCGDNKPSVDTPIQLKLYQALPNIKYMIHSHCYVEGAKFTTTSIPCGAIEEVDEVLKFIDENYHTRGLDQYFINLKGHGSIIMGKTLDDINNCTYIGRDMPERMW